MISILDVLNTFVSTHNCKVQRQTFRTQRFLVTLGELWHEL